MNGSNERTVRFVAGLIIVAFSDLIAVNAVVRGVSVMVGVGILRAVVVVSLVVLLGTNEVGDCGGTSMVNGAEGGEGSGTGAENGERGLRYGRGSNAGGRRTANE